MYKTGTKLTDRISGEIYVVSESNSNETRYRGASGRGVVKTAEIATLFEGDGAETVSALDTQVGGDHYKKLGDYQPWEVLRHWLTPEEFRGYMKGTAIAYLARERDKGGMMDVGKAAHTLQALVELLGTGDGSP